MQYLKVSEKEKNTKDGVQWTEDEIFDIYKLFKQLNGFGINEYNPHIQDLAFRLDRTIKEIEKQILVFTNIERSGNSSLNKNKLSEQIWNKNEHVYKVSNASSNLIQIPTAPIFDYCEWNKRLVNYFFKPELANKEIICFPVSSDLFIEISDELYSFEDFERSVKKVISKDIVDEIKKQYDLSIPHKFRNKTVKKPLPSYFAFLIFLIYGLSEYEDINLQSSNVYDRINSFGLKSLNDKWKNINSTISKRILEPAWEYIEDWTVSDKNKKLGYFILRNPKAANRKYVSRFERHSILNRKQFRRVFDILIEYGITIGLKISLNLWLTIINKYKERIHNSKSLLSYLKEGNDIQKSVLKFLNSYYENHYSGELTSSNDGKFRTPPIWLKTCIKEIPEWNEELIEEYYFRAFTENLEKDTIEFKNNKHSIELEANQIGRSKRVKISLPLDKKEIFSSERNKRYTFNGGIIWLEKNHIFNEWIEVSNPGNVNRFCIIVNEHITEEILDSGVKFAIHPISKSNQNLLYFNNLNKDDFDIVYKYYNPDERLEGKIELITEFTNDRRRKIYNELDFKFRFIGPYLNPEVFLQTIDDTTNLQLVQSESDNSNFCIPKNVEIKGYFYVYEKHSKARTPFNYNFGKLDEEPTNIFKPSLRNYEGEIFHFENGDKSIYDIPPKFGRLNYNISQFNAWQAKLYNIFKPNQYIIPKESNIKLYRSSHFGNKILKYLSLKRNISTRDFPQILSSFDSNISKNYARRILIHWRDLGYINFLNFGEQIKVNPTSIFFLATQDAGLKGFLTGYRNQEFINRLHKESKKLGLSIQVESHSEKYQNFYPQKVSIYSSRIELDKFFSLKNKLGITYVNNIRHPLHPDYAIYQLACFFTQRSCMEFKDNLENRINYKTDHYRKSVFDLSNLVWRETTKNIDLIPNNSIVRFDGFLDKSIMHVYKTKNGNKLLSDIGLAIFNSLEYSILLKKSSRKHQHFDFYIPLKIPLPFWIEKGLILLKAKVPGIRFYNQRAYRVYTSISERILNVIENKLKQKITIIYD